jgi:hypothetical protein
MHVSAAAECELCKMFACIQILFIIMMFIHSGTVCQFMCEASWRSNPHYFAATALYAE